MSYCNFRIRPIQNQFKFIVVIIANGIFCQEYRQASRMDTPPRPSVISPIVSRRK